jgi:hypothetical protein
MKEKPTLKYYPFEEVVKEKLTLKQCSFEEVVKQYSFEEAMKEKAYIVFRVFRVSGFSGGRAA